MDDRDQELEAVLAAVHRGERGGQSVPERAIAVSTGLDLARVGQLLARAQDLAYVVHVGVPLVGPDSPLRTPPEPGWLLLTDGRRYIGVPPTDAFGNEIAE